MDPALPKVRSSLPDPSTLPDLSSSHLTLLPGWAIRNPVDALVHLMAFVVSTYMGFTAASTLWNHWPEDCAFGMAFRVICLPVMMATWSATSIRIQMYKLAKHFKTDNPVPRKPFLQVRMEFTRVNSRLLGAGACSVYGWTIIPVLYLLFIYTPSPGCTTLCCGPETSASQLETGGGAPLMIDDTLNRTLLWLYLLNFVLINAVMMMSKDPVEDETYKEFEAALKRSKGHGGG